MLCHELGVLSGSEYYLNTPAHDTKNLYFYTSHCGHYHCDFGYSIRREKYLGYLLMYIKQGTMKLSYNEKEFQANSGQIVFIDCSMPHYYYTEAYMEFYWAHIDGSNTSDLYDHITKDSIVISPLSSDALDRDFYSLISKHKNNQSITNSEYSRSIYNILYHLMPETSNQPDNSDSVIERAKRYINEHVYDKLTVGDIALYVNLSPYYFIRLFKKETGSSPHNYQIKLRLDNAKYLLKNTNLSISEISRIVGYQSEISFSNMFVSKIGIPPGKFRKFPY